MTSLTSAAEIAGLTLLVLALTLAMRRRPARPRPEFSRPRPSQPQPGRPALRLVSRAASPAAAPGASTAQAAGPAQARRPTLALVEDRVPGAAALELEEAIGAGDQEHSVPEPGSVLATRDR